MRTSCRSHWCRALTLLFGPLVALATLAGVAGAQGARIVGTVTDSATGQPLPSVQVSVGGTRLGALTRADGSYAIANVPPGTYVVETRRIGYAAGRRADVRVAGDSAVRVDFRLVQAVLRLQEVVTIGVTDPTAGTRTPFTVDKITADQVPVPATNAVETIAGRVAGATIISEGQPGSGINVQLRTPASIYNSNAPLIVVDGVILSRTGGATTADLNSLDVESIEVIKGAAAASLYGSRASNGVISIRTRRGRELTEGRTRVTVRSEYGSNALQSPIEFSRYSAFLVQDGAYVDTAGNPVDRVNRVFRPAGQRFQDQLFPGGTFDQIDRFFDPGTFTQNSITLSRNQGPTNFLVTLSNQGTAGIIQDNGGYRRNDIRVNLDFALRDDLTFATSTYYSRSHRDDLDGDLFFDLVQQSPDIDLAARDDAGAYVFQPDQFGVRPNPVYTLATQAQSTRRTRALGSLESRFAPLPWLSFNANASFDRGERTSDFFQDAGVRSGNPDFDAQGGLTQLDVRSTAVNAAASANLIGRTGQLTARGSARALMEREQSDRTGFRGSGLIVPGVFSPTGVTQRLPVDEDFLGDLPVVESRTNSYIGTVGADYAGRYIADALVRRDGSSLFGPEERWQTYYRASAAWRAAQESWWPFKRAITEFKPRISRGTAGGRPSFPDQYETFEINDQGGISKGTLGNRFLKPELATETEAGLDVIFGTRVSLQTSYSRSRVTDNLVLIPLSANAGGFPFQWQNAGAIKGSTFETTLEARVLDRRNLGWTVGLVADRTRHRITQFDRPCFTTGTGDIAYRCAGETLGTMYGAIFVTDPSQLAGLSEADRALFQRNDQGFLVPVGADGDWRDAQWGTTVTTAGGTAYGWGLPIVALDSTGNPRFERIGDGNPKFRWGLSNNLRWGGFAFFALLDAQVGGDIYNRTKQRMYQNYRSADVDQAGRAEELKKPLEYFDRLYFGNNVNAHFVEPGGYLKLRELSVRYRLGGRPLQAFARTGARGVTVGLIGRNLLTFTDYSGYDPEVGSVNARIDNFDYPRFRTITGTVEVEF